MIKYNCVIAYCSSCGESWVIEHDLEDGSWDDEISHVDIERKAHAKKYGHRIPQNLRTNLVAL